eukprot:CAMPEP_0180196394 /NCGR_PEP_ID=MMETSP0987-20121128/4088_1 /TAXON_ID=697907 /ORGANISM="non described non described, Strain CCMP2293" /LENGTH=153 /DNA_ID=CAMNT_0022151281 /DNA_START=184 /DNA_END=641 /DNA_ORIENTATION=+
MVEEDVRERREVGFVKMSSLEDFRGRDFEGLDAVLEGKIHEDVCPAFEGVIQQPPENPTLDRLSGRPKPLLERDLLHPVREARDLRPVSEMPQDRRLLEECFALCQLPVCHLIAETVEGDTHPLLLVVCHNHPPLLSKLRTMAVQLVPGAEHG